MKVRIFLGSSGATERWARDIQDLIREERDPDVEVQGWWRRESFPIGTPTLTALTNLLQSCNAALLLAGPDDDVTKKGVPGKQPRDNVVFEYGLFCGAHGSARTALAVLPAPPDILPQLASDWDGVAQLRLKYAAPGKEFRETNRSAVLQWVTQLKETEMEVSDLRKIMLPRADQSFDALARTSNLSGDVRQRIDTLAAEFLESLVKLEETKGFGYEEMYTALLRKNLRRCNSIYALDVLGPAAWIGPASFRYLSLQLWQYLRANARAGHFTLTVGDALGNAIERAIRAAVQPPIASARTLLKESRTDFDSRREVIWERGKPVTEYVRILLWSPDELRSPIAEPIIAIHEAFHVPLFFLPTARDAPQRGHDFLLIAEENAVNIFGFVSRAPEFHPVAIDEAGPREKQAYVNEFLELLNRPDLMFAGDARHYLT